MTHLPIDPDLLDDNGRGRLREPTPSRDNRRPPEGRVLVAVAVGGGVGSLLRYGTSVAFSTTASGFPWATFLVNVGGCLMIGALMVAAAEMWAASWWPRPLLGVGLLGGLTTYSTMMLEARDLASASEWAVAGAYLSGSVLSGLLAVWAGMGAARLLLRSASHRGAGEDRR